MKQFLLPSLLLSAALGVTAATPAADLQLKSVADIATVKTVTSSGNTTARHLAPGATITTNHGLKRLNVAPERFATNKIAPRKARKAAPFKAAENSDRILFESFEGWDGQTAYWIPTDWTVDHKGSAERKYSWIPSAGSTYYPSPADGNYYFGVDYSSDPQDEWLISPYVQVGENMTLSYYAFLNPLYVFVVDSEHVDFNTYEFIGDPVVSATLQVWAQEEGGEWTMLFDHADLYKDYSPRELTMMTPTSLEKHSVDLKDFVGKKTRVAFRYVGVDGDVAFIDAISIGLPEFEGVNYMDPFETLYWGFERGAELSGLGADIAMFPVYSPLTWTNAFFEDADLTWIYSDPATGDLATSDDPEELVLTYVPDYSSAETMKNNLFYPPTLTASAPGTATTSFTAPYALFQAGGKAERTLADGTEFNASLFPFGYNDLGIARLTANDDDLGAWALPVFGHDIHSDAFWLNYSLNGNEANPTDYARLEGIANLFYAPKDVPLVVNGLSIYGFGAMDADAELTASIYHAPDGEFDYATMTPVASATIKGSDIITLSGDGSKEYLCLPFDFAEPAIVQNSGEDGDIWVFLLTGFNSDKVEYFAPLQSINEDRNYFSWGNVLKHIDLTSHGVRDSDYWNLAPLAYYLDGEYVDVYASFAIGIEGEYPWLTTDCDGIELGTEPVEVALGSYYDGSKLTVEAPAGITATVAGRYNECKLTVAHSDATVEVEGNITVKGPGVEVTIPVKAASGIADITAEGATLIGLYDLNGRSISRENAPTGIYVAKYSDGTARKVAIK